MTRKQTKALRLVKEFTPSWITDWSTADMSDNEIGIDTVIQSSKGVTASEAFFLKTERGVMPPEVKNKTALRKYLWGQKWMAIHVKMWEEGIREGRFYAFELKPTWRKLL